MTTRAASSESSKLGLQMQSGSIVRRYELAPVIAGKRRSICCHRAMLSGKYPPNSLAAVKECVAAGAPRLEIDVRFLADEAMLVFHDTELAHETTGTGRVNALDAPAARTLRYRADPTHGICFLDDVVQAMRDGETILQVDLKLMRPIVPARVKLLAEVLAPLGDRVLIGSRAQWNLHPFAELGFRVAFDPTLQWNYEPDRQTGGIPARMGVWGLWDDSPLAGVPYATADEYLQARVTDLAYLLPAAVEWMVDIRTLRYLGSLGFPLGCELERRGIQLAVWTIRDAGEDATSSLMRELFSLGATTIIANDALTIGRYAMSLGL